jgi:hypothetical protein
MDGNDEIIAEVKDEDQVDLELNTLSSDDEDIEGAADTEPQETDTIADPSFGSDIPSQETGSLDDDTGTEEGIDPLANR